MLRTFLLCGAALATLLTPAFADDEAIVRRLDAMQRMIDRQQREIQEQRQEIRSLRRALGKRAPARPAPASVPHTAQAPPPATVAARLDQQQAQIDTIAQATQQSRLAQQDAPVWSFVNGRPIIETPDKRFSLAVRALGQFDVAYYIQSADARRLPVGNDLSSGSNFRRAQLGIQGKVFDDWGYFFNYEFGGSGTEGGGRIQSLYVAYNGFAPLAFRIGAYPPPGGLEDNTSSADTIFLERAAPSEVLRNTVGGDGRHATSITYAGSEFYAALSFTGGRVGDAAVFDEQQSLLARVAGLVVNYPEQNVRVALSASGAYVLKAADTAAGPGAARLLTLSSIPELSVDSTAARLISTGAINTDHVTIWGVEAATQWASLYVQGGYFDYAMERRQSSLSDPDFSGWYVQGSWVITGEARGYNAQNAVFTQPKPRIAFSPETGGWGAWEFAARYSVVDFDYRAGHAGAPGPADGIRGGEQQIWTIGLNWYPNSVIRFAFDYQHIDVDRLGTIPAFGPDPAIPNTQIGQEIDMFSLRTQVSF
jgi:phosphate-selective porin OprO/OprP